MLVKAHQTTDRDFKLFKEEFKHWLEYWNLKGWEVCYRHDELDGLRGCVYLNNEGRIATVVFSTIYDSRPDDDEIRRVAFHEARELFYGTVRRLAESRYITKGQLDEAIHACIRTDENTIFEESLAKRKGKRGKKGR